MPYTVRDAAGWEATAETLQEARTIAETCQRGWKGIGRTMRVEIYDETGTLIKHR